MRKIILLFMTVMALNATTPTYENVTTLYVATFDRTPDVAGLKYWINDSGLNLEEIASSFMLQPESKAKYYPNDTIYAPDFVDTVYLNVFDRLPDSAGKEYWVDEIEKGGFARISVFILAVINGAQGNDATLLANKTKYALDAIKDQLDPVDPVDPAYPDEIKDAFNRNNEIRAELYSGSNLAWSTVIAQSAQKYANILAVNGEFSHSHWEYGENLFAASYSVNYTDAINSWYAEKSDYSYADNSCTPGAQCGHYTQLIWRNTTEFGCGSAIYEVGQYQGWEVIVCQYNPPGNYIGQKPY